MSYTQGYWCRFTRPTGDNLFLNLTHLRVFRVEAEGDRTLIHYMVGDETCRVVVSELYEQVMKMLGHPAFTGTD